MFSQAGVLLFTLLLAGSPLAGEAEVTESLSPVELRVLSLDLFGRPPSGAELEAWQSLTREAWLERTVGSREFWNNWLEEELYYFLLVDNFRPPPERLGEWTEALDAGRLAVRDVQHRIAISTEFDRRNPGPDTFVTVVMEQILGYTVQRSKRELEIGKKLYDGGAGNFLGKTGSSQADVVRIAVEDRRSLENLLTRAYQRLMRAELPRRQVVREASKLEEDPRAFTAIMKAWLASDAWAERLQHRRDVTNRIFVRSLYVDLFDRLPTDQETRRMRNALDGLADARPLRSILARLVLDSGRTLVPQRDKIEDPSIWIRGLFVRLLGRDPEPTELSTFLEVYAEPECRPETVVYALVSHPEYQTW